MNSNLLFHSLIRNRLKLAKIRPTQKAIHEVATELVRRWELGKRLVEFPDDELTKIISSPKHATHHRITARSIRLGPDDETHLQRVIANFALESPTVAIREAIRIAAGMPAPNVIYSRVATQAELHSTARIVESIVAALKPVVTHGYPVHLPSETAERAKIVDQLHELARQHVPALEKAIIQLFVLVDAVTAIKRLDISELRGAAEAVATSETHALQNLDRLPPGDTNGRAPILATLARCRAVLELFRSIGIWTTNPKLRGMNIIRKS